MRGYNGECRNLYMNEETDIKVDDKELLRAHTEGVARDDAVIENTVLKMPEQNEDHLKSTEMAAQRDLDSVKANLADAEVQAERSGAELDTSVLSRDAKDIARDGAAQSQLDQLSQKARDLAAQKTQHDLTEGIAVAALIGGGAQLRESKEREEPSLERGFGSLPQGLSAAGKIALAQVMGSAGALGLSGMENISAGELFTPAVNHGIGNVAALGVGGPDQTLAIG